jgi:superfamily II DNA or RNA helicase
MYLGTLKRIVHPLITFVHARRRTFMKRTRHDGDDEGEEDGEEHIAPKRARLLSKPSTGLAGLDDRRDADEILRCREMALDVLASLLPPGDVSPADMDRQKHYAVFEAACAFHYGLVMYEALHPDVLERFNAPRYRDGRGQDMGVDLVSPDGLLTMQCKWYGSKSTVSFTALSTFHTFSDIMRAERRILVLSEDSGGVHSLAKNLPIEVETMPSSRLDTIVSLARRRREKAPSRVIEPAINDVTRNVYHDDMGGWKGRYQRDAYDVVLGGIRNRDRIVYLHVTGGAGKTCVYVRALMASVADPCSTGRQAVVFVPSLQLVDHVARQFALWAPDLRVARVSGVHKDDRASANVIVCTYQSAEKIRTTTPYRAVVLDEGHRVISAFFDDADDGDEDDDDDQEGRTKRNGHFIRRYVPADTYVFASATLPEIDGISSGKHGPAFTYPLECGVRDGAICDYTITVPVFDGENYTNALAEAVAEHHEWRRVLAYCNSRVAAREFAQTLRDAGVSAVAYDGDTPLPKRAEHIEALQRGMLRVLVTVGVLREGVDIPCADTVLFVEPRNGRIDVMQCLMRVLRTHPSKAFAHVVLPALHEGRELRRFLRIIDRHDKRVSDAIRAKRSGRVNVLSLSSTLVRDIDNRDAAFLHETVFDRLGCLLVSPSWKGELLRRWFEENGADDGSKIPTFGEYLSDYENQNLGGFLNGLRSGRCKDVHNNLMDTCPRYSASHVVYKNAKDEREKHPTCTPQEKGELLRRWFEENGSDEKVKLPPQIRLLDYKGQFLRFFISNMRRGKSKDVHENLMKTCPRYRVSHEAYEAAKYERGETKLMPQDKGKILRRWFEENGVDDGSKIPPCKRLPEYGNQNLGSFLNGLRRGNNKSVHELLSSTCSYYRVAHDVHKATKNERLQYPICTPQEKGELLRRWFEENGSDDGKKCPKSGKRLPDYNFQHLGKFLASLRSGLSKNVHNDLMATCTHYRTAHERYEYEMKERAKYPTCTPHEKGELLRSWFEKEGSDDGSKIPLQGKRLPAYKFQHLGVFLGTLRRGNCKDVHDNLMTTCPRYCVAHRAYEATKAMRAKYPTFTPV